MWKIMLILPEYDILNVYNAIVRVISSNMKVKLQVNVIIIFF